MNNNNLAISVKKWFEIDEKIKQLQDEIKGYKIKKKQLSNGLIVEMKDKNIDVVNTNNGKLCHTEKKVKSSITKILLKTCFEKFISEASLRDKMLDYIYNSREIKIVENIKRK